MSNHESDHQIERFLSEMERKGLSRRDLLRRALAGGAALTLPALIAACGGDDEGAGEALETTGGATTVAGATTGEAAAEPNRGGRIRMGVVGGGNAETLDLNLSLNEIDVPRTRTLFEGLTDYDPEGAPVNVLAEELTPNEDGSQWTAVLVQGVEFHDGKTMTADDVIYSFQYLFDPKNKAQGAAAS
jgi:peptide/nickel transport system substrate-binding protein